MLKLATFVNHVWIRWETLLVSPTDFAVTSSLQFFGVNKVEFQFFPLLFQVTAELLNCFLVLLYSARGPRAASHS